jgi:hypothetical protein
MPPDLLAGLREHKPVVIDLLAAETGKPTPEIASSASCLPRPGWQSLPPGTLPLNPVMPRPTPHDRERMIAYLLRQGCDRPGPLTAWLVRRETAYFEGPGRHWDCALHAYAAACDAACWQLNRNERELWEFLDGVSEAADRQDRPPKPAAQ